MPRSSSKPYFLGIGCLRLQSRGPASAGAKRGADISEAAWAWWPRRGSRGFPSAGSPDRVRRPQRSRSMRHGTHVPACKVVDEVAREDMLARGKDRAVAFRAGFEAASGDPELPVGHDIVRRPPPAAARSRVQAVSPFGCPRNHSPSERSRPRRTERSLPGAARARATPRRSRARSRASTSGQAG